jgi:hypothetical protein
VTSINDFKNFELQMRGMVQEVEWDSQQINRLIQQAKKELQQLNLIRGRLAQLKAQGPAN